MLRPHNRVDRWRGLRAVGRMGLALAGGGVFAFLAWQPRQAQDTPARQPGAVGPAAEDRLATADSQSADVLRESAAALEGILSRRSGAGSPGVAAIEPKGRPEAAQVTGVAALAGASNAERTRVTTIAEGSGRSNPMAPPRGPP